MEGRGISQLTKSCENTSLEDPPEKPETAPKHLRIVTSASENSDGRGRGDPGGPPSKGQEISKGNFDVFIKYQQKYFEEFYPVSNQKSNGTLLYTNRL